jgi:hypothetical protein
MANIYEEKTEGLHQLLDRARADDGATVLIPDLQRPYVWTPNQVSLLVDSLIRGWPFGTLLMWKVGRGELQNIPHRQFWRVVERTGDGNGSVVGRKDPPATYHMVLDGQQRVQSLLLALGGDAWGFKLEDRDWAQELQDRRLRGRQGKYRHWSKASLCFDLDPFFAEYTTGGNLLAVDFRNVLQWVITDPAEGQSKWSKPGTYEEPLPRSFTEQNKGRFIRLSRLWAAATPNPNIKEAQFREILKELFGVEGVRAEKAEKLLVPMGELMTTLRDLKLSKVTYLELVAFDKHIWTEDSYNDAIVNIFTRLNTAGRTLTREEITLAWLKVGWDQAATGGKTAGECFQELLADLADRGLDIEMDSLVNAVSFIWSVCCNEGQLLANRDLLRGATIRPMASELAKRWSDIRRAVLAGLDAVNGRELEYGLGGHYSSLNALAVVWAWLYVAFQWEAHHRLTVPQRDDFEKKLTATLSSVLDRWLICSHWAGRWAGSSSPIIAGYAKGLHEAFLACAKLDALESVYKVLSDQFQAFVNGLETDAANFVGTLAASSRERVSVYRTALWIWHRLDAERWEMSCIPLKVGKGKASLDVDHAVAYALWEAKLAAGLPTGIEDRADALPLVNMLGNCSLLEKTFNISKSDKTLRAFMEQVHEFKEGKVALSSWAQALGLVDSMLDAAAGATDAIVQALETRDKAIRAELVEFVKGTKTRVDL